MFSCTVRLPYGGKCIYLRVIYLQAIRCHRTSDAPFSICTFSRLLEYHQIYHQIYLQTKLFTDPVSVITDPISVITDPITIITILSPESTLRIAPNHRSYHHEKARAALRALPPSPHSLMHASAGPAKSCRTGYSTYTPRTHAVLTQEILSVTCVRFLHARQYTCCTLLHAPSAIHVIPWVSSSTQPACLACSSRRPLVYISLLHLPRRAHTHSSSRGYP